MVVNSFAHADSIAQPEPDAQETCPSSDTSHTLSSQMLSPFHLLS